jgi:hypothetical protein
MKLFVMHTCDNHYHTYPRMCNCYAISRDNAQLKMMCTEKQRIDALGVHETACGVHCSSSGTVGWYDVCRLEDSEKESPNNRI